MRHDDPQRSPDSPEAGEARLDALLGDAASTYRLPPEAPFDLIWSRVDAERLRDARPSSPRVSRGLIPAALAASLLVGVLVGRYTVRGSIAGSATAATDGPQTAASGDARADARSAAAPYQRETERFLGNTAMLLAALPRGGTAEQAPTLLPQQAAQLLTTTRLLLDSPVGTDPRLRDLLQDLELVLAQVARLQPRRQRTELTLITQTLTARDLVPRIRSAVTDLNFSDYPE